LLAACLAAVERATICSDPDSSAGKDNRVADFLIALPVFSLPCLTSAL
jgi:hypothetical protein